MNTAVSTQRRLHAVAGTQPETHRAAAALQSALLGLWARIGEARRHAAARREFALLDDATLRDLDLHRGEFESYWAESHGLAERTRLRVLRQFGDTPL